MSDPILVEDSEGLNVVTTLEEARKQIELLNHDKNHMRKIVMLQRDEIHTLYNALHTIQETFGVLNDGINEIVRARKTR